MSKLLEKIKDLKFHTLSIEKTLELLESSSEGLNEKKVSERLEEFGKNELQEKKKKTLFQKFLAQFSDLMVIILIVAAIISGFMKEITDAVIIFFVVIINAVLGVIQESKAEKALEALKKMSKPFAKVKRNGEVQRIRTEDLLPGDIVLIEAGDTIPADLRLIEAVNLKIEEASITGESVPSEKSIEVIEKENVVLGDRKNMAYMGTNVTYGRGIGIVTATGMNTEVGKIAGFISEQEEEQTPLQIQLERLGKYLSIGIIIIAIIIFIAGILEGREKFEMFLTAVSLAVAAIPEGLPAVVTIVLAIGVQKMAKRHAIIRKLTAVETLGCTEIICSDKTGTLTQNKMTVKEIYFNNKLIKVEDISDRDKNYELFIEGLALCNDVKVNKISEDKINSVGDPTEIALVDFAFDKGYFKNTVENIYPRVNEIPFDSDRKLMTTVHAIDKKYRIITKGAADILLEKCTHIFLNNEIVPINNEHKNLIKNANTNMAKKALRVLGLAFKDNEKIEANLTTENTENNLVFLGLVGMIDPPREEVKDAVAICKEAGIRPIMITGDHKDTATAIAKDIGIIKNENEVISGSELDKIDEKTFEKDVEKYSVYARVSPEHKVKIVKAWKAKEKIVAMSGDGVNDAPALKSSDIGVGMGITGTDVTKSVSDMVLSDDNFATIVAAVEEGRKIYSNIRKCIQFLLSSNLSEVLTLFVATMLNWTILLPIHILWINLVTDTFPALAMAAEKGESDLMKQKPRDPKSNFFSEGVGISIIYQGILLGILTLLAYYLGKKLYQEDIIAETMAFATLSTLQLFHAFNVRSNTKSIFEIGIFSNLYMVGAFIISAFLQYSIIYLPILNKVFKVQALDSKQLMIVLALSFAIIPIVEIVKLIKRIIKK